MVLYILFKRMKIIKEGSANPLHFPAARAPGP